MVASCVVLVGLSYYIASLMSGMVAIPRTPVKEYGGEGELLLSVSREVLSMETSRDGRFLCLLMGGEQGENTLAVYDLEDGDAREEAVFQRGVRGFRAAWVGTGHRLVFEDRGDLWSLDADAPGSPPFNLTASEEYDEDPIPSPRGDYILWTVSNIGSVDHRFWVMRPDGTQKRYLAPRCDMVAWSPGGGRVISATSTLSEGGGESKAACLLQEAWVGEEGWNFYLRCEEKVGYLWWPPGDDIYFLAPREMGGDERRTVWFKVRPSGKVLREASTDGVTGNVPETAFFPEREGGRIAYLGEKGLEVMDVRRREVSRYPELEVSRPVLAWRESLGALLYLGPEGVYQLALE